MEIIKVFLVLLNIFISQTLALPALSYDEARSLFAVEPNESAGTMLKEWSKGDMKGNAEEQGPYLEGDIIISDARNGVALPGQRWPKGIIPYEIDAFLTQEQKNMLSNAIDEIKSKTCVKLIPRGGEKDYVVFKNDDSGCWSSVGKTGGRQVINLQAPCLRVVGTAIHEIMHAIGFYHEQNRGDRDTYVTIRKDNIQNDKYINFEKLSPEEEDNLGTKYDYKSVLHYSPYSFSKNGQPTIETKGAPSTSDQMGQREGLSSSDILKINRMYNCT
ncbi:zinc metalloproteinase nas-4-like [Chironomus tepperi]|uniref:zinc metalloproteinase nas-4-like n=1 Tax=Chironomus tepperi TaxID=113505 RepID=UPI00391FB1E2